MTSLVAGQRALPTTTAALFVPVYRPKPLCSSDTKKSDSQDPSKCIRNFSRNATHSRPPPVSKKTSGKCETEFLPWWHIPTHLSARGARAPCPCVPLQKTHPKRPPSPVLFLVAVPDMANFDMLRKPMSTILHNKTPSVLVNLTHTNSSCSVGKRGTSLRHNVPLFLLPSTMLGSLSKQMVNKQQLAHP